jgi:hypothetical protein
MGKVSVWLPNDLLSWGKDMLLLGIGALLSFSPHRYGVVIAIVLIVVGVIFIIVANRKENTKYKNEISQIKRSALDEKAKQKIVALRKVTEQLVNKVMHDAEIVNNSGGNAAKFNQTLKDDEDIKTLEPNYQDIKAEVFMISMNLANLCNEWLIKTEATYLKWFIEKQKNVPLAKYNRAKSIAEIARLQSKIDKMIQDSMGDITQYELQRNP